MTKLSIPWSNNMDHEYSYAYTELVIRDPKAERHYRTVDPRKLEFRRGTVICLSGNAATDLKSANSFAKMAQTNLDLMFKSKDGKNALDYVDIFGVKYARRSKNYGCGFMTKDFSNQLTNAMLKLLTDQNGHRLPVDQAKQNFSRITFFTYCYGNLCLNDIIDLLNEKLLDLGYTAEEVTSINNASMEVSFAGLNPAENRLPSVRVLSFNDPVVSSDLSYLEANDPKIQNLDGIALHQDPIGQLYGRSRCNATAPSIQVISSNLIDLEHGFHVIYNDHNIKCVSFNKDWKLNPCEINHENFAPSNNAKCTAESMAIATCFGVTHSLNNLHTEVYQPHQWDELVDDLQFNIDSYAPKKLSHLKTEFTSEQIKTMTDYYRRELNNPLPGFRMDDGLTITNKEAGLKTNIDAAPLQYNGDHLKD